MKDEKLLAEHGDEYKGELAANFSSNVWFGADHEGLYAHLTDKMPLIRRYPEEYNQQLIAELGHHLQLNPDQLLLTNGTAEGIYLLAQAYRGAKSLIVAPTFSEYGKACQVHEHQIVHCSATALEAYLEKELPRLVWICTPNNPDGYSFELSILEKLVKEYENTVFIFDVSFREYCREKQPDAEWVSKFENVILLYSFTKRYGIPGLRMGYIHSKKAIIRTIGKYSIPWAINSFAVEAFRYLICNHVDNFDIDEWLLQKKQFTKQINTIDGFECLDSSTPFFLVKLLKGKSADLKDFLLERGILVRDASNFFRDGSQYIRLLTLPAEKNELLLNELNQWSQQL
jgi:threonine-phosphate decarboxylase